MDEDCRLGSGNLDLNNTAAGKVSSASEWETKWEIEISGHYPRWSTKESSFSDTVQLSIRQPHLGSPFSAKETFTLRRGMLLFLLRVGILLLGGVAVAGGGLLVPHGRVLAAHGQQLVVGAALDDLALL